VKCDPFVKVMPKPCFSSENPSNSQLDSEIQEEAKSEIQVSEADSSDQPQQQVFSSSDSAMPYDIESSSQHEEGNTFSI